MAAAARAALVAAGGRVDGGWLDEGFALRLGCDLAIDEARAALRRLTRTADVIVAAAGFAPALFVADMDSTIVGCECLDELADYAGKKREVAAITARAMAGELDFADALTGRVRLLAGLERSAVAACLAERVRPNPGAATLLATLAKHGVRTMLVTGGFADFAEPVADALGFDRCHANRLEWDGDRMTGEVLPPIVDRAGKRSAMAAEAGARGGVKRAVAIGDGANDIDMVGAAGLGLAYRPKPALAAVAHGVIAHGDLTSVLWALGWPRAMWAA